jgi:hypothetical protein
MNLTGRIVLGVMQLISIGLGIMIFSAIAYAVVQLCIGNYHSTASFEF